MKTLLFTDPHIKENALEELGKIFQEICSYKADRLIMLGDYFNNNKSTPSEIYFGAYWAKKFTKHFKEVVFIKGNHDVLRKNSAVDFMSLFGIEVVDTYVDEDNNFYGHFMLQESPNNYESNKSLADYKQYNNIFLGHEHTPFQYKNMYHIGSCRFCHFNETSTECKYVYIINGDSIKYYNIGTAILMLDVYDIERLKRIVNSGQKYKVRYIFNSLEEYQKNYSTVIDLLNNPNIVTGKTKIDFTNEIANLSINQIDDDIKSIIESCIEELDDIECKQLLKGALLNVC